MRAVLQRVTSADVSVDFEIVGSIDEGLVVYLGFAIDDTEVQVDKFVEKIS